jgi:hypothetical protein
MQNYNFTYSLNGRKTSFLALRKEQGLSVCENEVVKRIFGPTREVVNKKDGENRIMSSFVIFILHQILLAWSNKWDKDWRKL